MKIFLDTCDITAIKKYYEIGMIDGVTTNPSIIAKSGQSIFQVIKEICAIVDNSVSIEVVALETDEMLKEARQYYQLGKQVTIKLPLTENGLIACQKLSAQNISVNMTLCFSPAQALLAAKMGAEYVSPFIGRLDDIGQDGLKIIADICSIYGNYPDFQTKIIAASIRNTNHFVEAAKMGADIATISPKLLENLMYHELTQKGLEIFLNDWKKTGQN